MAESTDFANVVPACRRGRGAATAPPVPSLVVDNALEIMLAQSSSPKLLADRKERQAAWKALAPQACVRTSIDASTSPTVRTACAVPGGWGGGGGGSLMMACKF